MAVSKACLDSFWEVKKVFPTNPITQITSQEIHLNYCLTQKHFNRLNKFTTPISNQGFNLIK